MTDEINVEDELTEIADKVRVSMASKEISLKDGAPITILCCIASLLVEVVSRMEESNELLSDILETKDGCTSTEE